ncbi:MAG: ComEC/Rec2 family competence protein [Chthonomonadales bacterium]
MQMPAIPGSTHRHDLAALAGSIAGRPLVLVAFAFALGIQAASWWGWTSAVVLMGAAAAAALPALRWRLWIITSLLCGFAAIGACRLLATAGPLPTDISNILPEGPVTIRGIVAGEVDLRATTYGCFLAVQSATLPAGSVVKCSGRVALRLAKDEGKPPPAFGDTLEVRGILAKPPGLRNPGGFDYAAHLAHRGVYAVVNVRRPSGWKRLPFTVGWRDWLPNFASRCRMSLLEAMGRVLPKTEAGLAAGILLGARTELPPQLDDDFVATGTVHVLATAGLHVGIVAVLVLALLRFIHVPMRLAAAVAIAALITYAIMAGARPSVLRATVMACVFLFSAVVDREADVPAALAASALFLMLLEPNYLFDVGFQLSFATVASIVALMPVFEAAIQRMTGALSQVPGGGGRFLVSAGTTVADVVAVSTGAQLGSMPLTAQYFNSVSLVGIPANAAIVPVLVVVFAAGFTVWLLALIWLPAAQLVGHLLLSPVLAYLVGGAHAFAHVPAASVPIPSPGWLLISIYYAVLFIGTALFRMPRAAAGTVP